jgi:hypothetical protein
MAWARAGLSALSAVASGSAAAPVVKPVLRNVRRFSIGFPLFSPALKVYALGCPMPKLTIAK